MRKRKRNDAYNPSRYVGSSDSKRWCGNCLHGFTACNSIDHYCYDCEDKPERPKFVTATPPNYQAP